jgi:hypothetical protein
VVTLQQSRNQARATIKGIELKARAELGQSWGGVWNLRGGYGYTKGTGADGQGLESISPWQVKLGVGQKAARWNWELAATHHAAKKQSDVSTSSSALFATPSFTVLDLTTQVELRKGLRLNLGLFNLTDKKYWNWSDVRGVTRPPSAPPSTPTASRAAMCVSRWSPTSKTITAWASAPALARLLTKHHGASMSHNARSHTHPETASANQDEEYLLSEQEAVLAATLALMTGFAHGCCPAHKGPLPPRWPTSSVPWCTACRGRSCPATCRRCCCACAPAGRRRRPITPKPT